MEYKMKGWSTIASAIAVLVIAKAIVLQTAMSRLKLVAHITIPSLLVGRNTQKQQLLQEHAESCNGHFRAAFISGLSGIGKTRLIQELQLPIVTHSAYFTSGKFDQFKKHIPYSTLIQAWSNLVKTLLTEDKERIQYWQQRISQQLGEHAQLMIDLIPELQLILGKQSAVKELPPIEAIPSPKITQH